MKRQDYLKTLHLTESERVSLTDRLNAQSSATSDRAAAGKAERRQDRRWDFVQGDIPVIVEHLGGGISRFLVWSRNLATGGIAFLHGGYLHTGSRCKIDLKKLDGQAAGLFGTIVACRHVEGCNHEVCVKFDQRIVLAEFMKVNPAAEAKALAGNGSSPAGTASAGQPIEPFITQVKQSASQLQKALAESNREALRTLCQTLQQAASGSGSSELGLAASETLRALDAARDIKQVTEQVRQLTQMCERVAPKPKNPPPTPPKSKPPKG